MAHLIMDDCLGRHFTVAPSYNTSIVVTAGGGEEATAHWTSAKRRWQFSTRDLPVADMTALEVFFHQVLGRYTPFLFKQLTDYNHWQAASDTSPIVIATGDGSDTTFQLIKIYGSGATQRSRDITNPIPDSENIYLDGVLQEKAGITYTLDHSTGILTFQGPPGNGVVITAEYQFYNRVRFDSDELVIDPVDFRRKYYTATIGLVEVRP